MIESVSAGCWIDGHWGRFGSVRLLELALRRGWQVNKEDQEIVDRLLTEVATSARPATDDDWEALLDQGAMADHAEQWLNDNVAPDGLTFGWHDGEFFLWPMHVWHDDDTGACDCSSEQIDAAKKNL